MLYIVSLLLQSHLISLWSKYTSKYTIYCWEFFISFPTYLSKTKYVLTCTSNKFRGADDNEYAKGKNLARPDLSLVLHADWLVVSGSECWLVKREETAESDQSRWPEDLMRCVLALVYLLAVKYLHFHHERAKAEHFNEPTFIPMLDLTENRSVRDSSSSIWNRWEI